MFVRKLASTLLGPNFYDELKFSLNKFQRKRSKSVVYDHLTKLVIKKALQHNSICVDVGCHKGYILRMMMHYAPKGKCYAFEPLPDLYRELVRLFRKKNVKLYNTALSNKKGISPFNYVVSNPAYSGFIRRHYRHNEEEIMINVETDLLDNIMDPKQRISFIKIDVEGAELQVLEGAQNIIRRHKPIIVFEHGLGAADRYGTRPEDVYDLLLTKCGMRVSLLDDWLDNRQPLSKQEFHDQFYNRLNYYFIAHPDCRDELFWSSGPKRKQVFDLPF
jgi:FkbM family methyltransferase